MRGSRSLRSPRLNLYDARRHRRAIKVRMTQTRDATGHTRKIMEKELIGESARTRTVSARAKRAYSPFHPEHAGSIRESLPRRYKFAFGWDINYGGIKTLLHRFMRRAFTSDRHATRAGINYANCILLPGEAGPEATRYYFSRLP